MRLLIVEDDELLGDGMQAVLNQRGFTADWVQDGLVADQALKNREYELVILDLTLPDLSGFEILRRLRTAGNKIPVLVLTARSEIPDRVRALDGGADDYVVKPFDMRSCARAYGRCIAAIMDTQPRYCEIATWYWTLQREL